MNSISRDIVFTDTSVFIKENYFSPNNRILSLRILAEKGIISLVSTEITNSEIIKNFKEDVASACSNVKNNHKVIACFDETRPLLYKDTKKKLLKKCDETFQDFISKGAVYTIGYDYSNDVKSVFEKYFMAEKPFDAGKKKNEFPDAFVLLMLESYCKRNGLKSIIVLSDDKDMREYKSKYLKSIDYKEYITQKLTEATTLDEIKNTIQNEKANLCSDIKDKLEEELYNGWNYCNLFNTEDLPEVDIVTCNVKMDDNFSIISIKNDIYLIELNLSSYCEVKCTYFNLDYATYDREDRIWYGGEWETETLKGDEDFQMKVSYNRANGSLAIESFEIADSVPSFKHLWDY